MGKNTQIAELINYLSVDGSGNIVMTGNLIMPGGAQAATQTYVNSAISNLVNAAPTALDTLAELSTALNNDASFATTVTNNLASKLGLSGGTLTGALTGTTLSLVGTNNVGIKLKQGNQIFDAPSSTSFYNGLTFENTSTTNAWSIGYAQGAKFSINYFDGSSTYSRFLSITTGGAVGIGVLSPERILDIDATGSSAAIRLRKGSSNMIFLGTGSSSTAAGTENAILQMHHNGSERIRLYTEGNSWITGSNVGIGTTSPKELLEIAGLNGNIRIYGRGGVTQNGISSNVYYNGSSWVRDNGSTGSGAIRFDSDTNSIVFNTDTSTSGFPAERLRITSGGNVGIGTASPSKRLEISEDNSSTTLTTGLKITNWSGITDTRAGIVFQNYDNNAAAIWSRRTGSIPGELIFGTNGGAGIGEANIIERMRITSSGRIIVNNSVANDSGDRNLTIQGSLSATLNDVASINLAQIWNGVAYPAILAVQQDLTYGNASGAFVLKTSYWNGSSVSTGERLRVTGIGKVGIGTNSPDTYLHINSSTAQLKISGNTNSFAIYSWNGGVNLFSSENLYLGRDAAINNKFYFQNAAGSSTTMYVDTAGDKVGIGNISPLEKLSVSGNIHVAGVGNVLYFDTDASGRSISQYVANLYEFHILNGRGNSSRFVLGNGSISLGTSSTPQFYINTSSGNVGMGTTSPSYNLDIQGTEAKIQIKSTAAGGGTWIMASTYNDWSAGGGKYVITSNGGTTGIKFAIDSSGNVGIGTYTFSDLGFATPLLKVAGSRATLGLVSSGTLSTIALVSSNNNSTAMHLNYENTGAFRWYNYSSASEIFSLLGNGRLGLGVPNPDAKLHVGGAILVSNGAQTFRRAITCHGQVGTFSQVKVIFNKRDWGSVTYDIKLASAGGSYHTAGAYYSNPGFGSHVNSINAGNGPSMSLTAASPDGGTQGATWTFSGATMIHPMVTVDIACGNGYQVNPDDIIVQFN